MLTTLSNLKPSTEKLIAFAIVFTGIVVLIAMGKVPASTLQGLIFWVAGSMGAGTASPPPAIVGTDEKQDDKKS